MSRRTQGQVKNQPSKRHPRVLRSGSGDGVVGEETSMVEDDFGPWDD